MRSAWAQSNPRDGRIAIAAERAHADRSCARRSALSGEALLWASIWNGLLASPQ
jgi:hypothetical protein